jgi:Xaa-Pro aminopeptidase
VKELIKKRIADLRIKLKERNLDACIIYGTDPHLSEYLPAHWQTRPFISGFTGSAGIVIISMDKAALWTDSRYFLQAEAELSGTNIELVKMRTPGHPEPSDWLKLYLKPGDSAGTDAWCISVNQFGQLQRSLGNSGIILNDSGDLLNEIWTDRPALPDSPVFEHELRFACASRKTKVANYHCFGRSGMDFQLTWKRCGMQSGFYGLGEHFGRRKHSFY